MLNFEGEMNKINLHITFFLVFFTTMSVFAQVGKKVVKDTTVYRGDYLLYSGDTAFVSLEEVKILPKLEFEDYDSKRYYYWFRKKVLKAYPYAVLAADKLNAVNDTLEMISKKSAKRKYVKKRQKYLEEEFTPQLKKLTRMEGQVLIKLVYRQTGNTTFNVVKEYRSGWRAFWYNATAGVFKLSLKEEYHPESDFEDYMIEDILQRADNRGQIELQPSKLDFDYYKIPVPDGFGAMVPEEFKKRK